MKQLEQEKLAIVPYINTTWESTTGESPALRLKVLQN
jgi:hypothetical protein